MSKSIKYEIKKAGLLYFLRRTYQDILSSSNDKKMYFLEMFPNYEEYHKEINTGAKIRFELIKDWIEKDSTMLDVGVGDGLIAEYLMNELNIKIQGLDISENACKKAKQKGITSKVRDINYGLNLRDDEIYDYILLMEVIEHTVQPEKVVMDAVRHVKKGVIITIPNSGYIKWRIQLLRGYSPRQSYTHLHFWSIKDFEIWCKLLNLEIKSFTTVLPRCTSVFKNLLAWQQCWLLYPKRD
ncbi:MAG: methionine biosynthesis protein MetW [Nitrososphaeraceae archaeon]